MKKSLLLLVVGMLISITTHAQNPGGISANMIAWWDAKSISPAPTDSTGVFTWEDRFAGLTLIRSTFPKPPLFLILSDNLNGNPIVDNTNQDGFDLADNVNINTGSSYLQKSFDVVIRTGDDNSALQMVYEQGGSLRGTNIYIKDDSLKFGIWNLAETQPAGDWGFHSLSHPIDTNTAYIISAVYDGSDLGTGNISLYVNGELVDTYNGPGGATTANIGRLYQHTDNIGTFRILGQSVVDGVSLSPPSQFDGVIAELALFNSAHTAAEVQKIQTYLAIKYGISLNGNYVDASGNILYNFGNANQYTNGITGIGFDQTLSAIYQLKSRNYRSGKNYVSISADTTNAQDGDYLIWGHNGSSISSVATSVGCASNRLARSWRLIQSGDFGLVTLEIDSALINSILPANDVLYLISASDSTFSTNVKEKLMLPDANGNYTASFLATSGVYYTLGTHEQITFNSGVWAGGTGVGGAPLYPTDKCKDIIVESGSLTITSCDSMPTLIIQPGTSLEVAANGKLIVDNFVNFGSAFVRADNTGYGQLAVFEEAIQVGNTTVERYIDNPAGYRMISSPIENGTVGDMSFTNGGQVVHPPGGVPISGCNTCNMIQYNTSIFNGIGNIGEPLNTRGAYGTWQSTGNNATQLEAAKGWLLYVGGGGTFGSTPMTLSMTGKIHHGTYLKITNTGHGGWNLAGNPYPTDVDWDLIDHAAKGLKSTYYIYDPAVGTYLSYNAGAGGVLGATRRIPPMQGIVVGTDAFNDSTPGIDISTFLIHDQYKSTSCLSGNVFKTEANKRLLLRASNGNLIDETVIFFDENATPGIGPLDGDKFFGAIPGTPQLFTQKAGKSLVFNAQALHPTKTVPLYLIADQGTQITLEAPENPDGVDYFLIDRKTNNVHQLINGSVTFNMDTNFYHRFDIVFQSYIGVPESGESPMKLAKNDQGYLLLNQKAPLNFEIFNLNGQRIQKGTIRPKEEFSLSDLSKGVYLLKLEDGTTFKLFH